jgi:multiple sugar transport system substrate-binding protein
MEIQAPNGAVQLQKAAPKLDLRVMNAVPFDGQAKGFMLGGAGPGLMINADSDKKKLASAFLKYMVSAKVSAQYTEGIGAVPIRASTAGSDYVKNSPILQAFAANAGNFQPNPNVPGWVQARDTLDKSLERALNKQQPSQQALGQAATEVNKILEASR